MKKRRRIKTKPFVIIGIIIILVFYTIKTINYHNSYEYKLKELNYSIEEIKVIETLNNDSIDYILTIEYDKNIVKFIKEKYFLEKNLKKYLKYAKENTKSKKDIVSIINVGSNNDFYTNTKETDTSLGNLILVNKYYSLSKDYTSKMKTFSSTHSFGSNQMATVDTYNAFIDMYNAAKSDDLTLIVNSSYRSYEDQEYIYNDYKEKRGLEGADLIAARPGFSEHQTGMALDIQTYGSTASTFEEFDEFKWLTKNAHKYGFILRYPKDKEYLTGYNYESWHFRYVGKEVATYIYENNITYDEYYAYYIEGDVNEKKKN